MSAPGFSGFPKQCVSFFQELDQNNNKEWFDLHRQDYEDFVQTPAKEFVLALGERLRKIRPEIQADPRVNKSLFRINRDVRFSKDKSPYKTNMGLWFWEGMGKRMECPGFYFHFEPSRLMLGCGFYMFSKETLSVYRDAVVDPKLGPALAKAIDKLNKNGFSTGGEHYKKTPRGYDPQHKNARLLLHNGLHCANESKIPKEFFTPEIVNYCAERYKKMLPLHEWLLKMMVRV